MLEPSINYHVQCTFDTCYNNVREVGHSFELCLLVRLWITRCRLADAGALADRLATYVVAFSDHCARAAPPELVFVSRDVSPVRVRVSTPRRHDVMRPLVAVAYTDRPRRILLPVGVRAVDNGTDDRGNEIASFCHRRLLDWPPACLCRYNETHCYVFIVA